MYKNLILAGSLLLSASFALAQTSREEVCAHLDKAGGVYYAYPEPTGAPTPAPKGYRPFYISHYGRHGSRYLISDHDYSWVMDALQEADSAHVLTALGREALARLKRLWPQVRHRGGDLSPVGVRQQQGIAGRMFRSFPEVFKGTRRVSAHSTIVMRCAMSMVAFGDELKGLAPQLSISYEASMKDMDYLNYHSPQSNLFTDGEKGPWVSEYKRFERSLVRPERFVNALISSPPYIRQYMNPDDLLWGFYWIAVDMQDIDTDIGFYDLFKPDELFDLWQCINYRFYVCNANHKDGQGIVVGNSRSLLRNIIEEADSAIRDNRMAATLRFGHDGNVIPLLAMLQIEHADVAISHPEDAYKVWSDFKMAPMAANIQIVFYRNKENDILVKFLHNEQEVHIPVPTRNFPYYHWEEVRDFYGKKAGLCASACK